MATIERSKVTSVLNTKDATIDKIVKLLDRPLGNPINGKEVGAKFTVTLTGKIEISEFKGPQGLRKSAHFTTKEGFRIGVNASFDKDLFKEGTKKDCICVMLPKNEEQGITRDIKFTQFVD